MRAAAAARHATHAQLRLLAFTRSRGVPPPRDRRRTPLSIPQTLSFRTNFDETARVIAEIRRSVFSAHTPVALYFDDLRELEPAATLVLTAEIHRCRQLRPWRNGLMVNGTYPGDRDAFASLRKLGFFDLIGVDDRSALGEAPPAADPAKPFFFKFRTFNTVDSVFAAQFCEMVVSNAFAMSPLAKGRMVAALKEAMGNAVEHAYMQATDFPPMKNRFWVTGYVDKTAGEMMITLFDQGVGIPNTLDPTAFERIRSALKARWTPTDGHMIAAATELHRSQTEQPGRGKGLQDMKKFIDTCDDGELRILSNRGGYSYIKGNETISDERLSICGTLVEWRVRHGSAVEVDDV